MSSNPTLVSISMKLPKNYIEALQKLRQAGYSDDQSLTQVSAIRQSIEDAWKMKFPDEPFPKTGES